MCGEDVLDGLATLVDHSLVTASERALRDAGDRARVRARAAGRGPGGDGDPPAPRTRLRRARRRADESGSAATSATGWTSSTPSGRTSAPRSASPAADGDAATALALFGGWRYWETRGNLAEGRALAATALASGEGPPALRLRTLNAAGVLAGEQGDFAGGAASCSPRASSWPTAPATTAWLARALGQPRQPRALRGRLRRGDPALRAGGRALARRGRARDERHRSRRTSGSPTAAPGSTSARSSCSTRAWCWRAARRIPRTSRRRCARWPARCCSGSATRRARSRCSARVSRCRSSSTSGPGSSRRWRRWPRSVDAAHGRRADRLRRGGAGRRGASRQPDEEAWVRRGQGDAARRRSASDGVRDGGAGADAVVDLTEAVARGRSRLASPARSGTRGATGPSRELLARRRSHATDGNARLRWTRRARTAGRRRPVPEGRRAESLHMNVLARAEAAKE